MPNQHMISVEWYKQRIDECRHTIDLIDKKRFWMEEHERNGGRIDATPELRQVCESIIQEMEHTLRILEGMEP